VTTILFVKVEKIVFTIQTSGLTKDMDLLLGIVHFKMGLSLMLECLGMRTTVANPNEEI
jgi:hypothetical protein